MLNSVMGPKTPSASGTPRIPKTAPARRGTVPRQPFRIDLSAFVHLAPGSTGGIRVLPAIDVLPGRSVPLRVFSVTSATSRNQTPWMSSNNLSKSTLPLRLL